MAGRGKEKDKGEAEKERGFKDDGAFVEGGDPIEDFDCTGNGHQESEK